MKTKTCRVIEFPYNKAEEVSDDNCDERLLEQKIKYLILVTEENIKAADLEDGVIGNSPNLNRARQFNNEKLKLLTMAYNLNLRQQKNLDNVIPFPEFAKQKRQPKEAA